jgi:maltose alpha-D-glucosyltransferase/alpha-amylase
LYTGKDFVFIGFDGPPAIGFSQRRRKRSPLADVACMLRSFDYAAESAVQKRGPRPTVRDEDRQVLLPAATLWRAWTSFVFVRAYVSAAQRGGFLPPSGRERRILMDALLAERAIHELHYELNHRPEWAMMPITALWRMAEKTE